MKMIPLNELFDIKHGTKLDFNKMSFDSEDKINFVSRTRENLGVICKVDRIDSILPLPAGTITVTLGGSYLLSAYIQQEEYYTAQNIKILTPIVDMDFKTKAFYCMCISHNRFRYTSHGREANKTLDYLLVPDIAEIPEWVRSTNIQKINNQSLIQKTFILDTTKWKSFYYDKIFEIYRGKLESIVDFKEGKIPVVSAIDGNNGILTTLDIADKYIEKGNCLTISNNGSIGEVFYQDNFFSATSDVTILRLINKDFSVYIALFLIAVIRLEKYRFNYGRKWGLKRMKNSIIKLPSDFRGNPDWEFMENYIKTLPYSSII